MLRCGAWDEMPANRVNEKVGAATLGGRHRPNAASDREKVAWPTPQRGADHAFECTKEDTETNWNVSTVAYRLRGWAQDRPSGIFALHTVAKDLRVSFEPSRANEYAGNASASALPLAQILGLPSRLVRFPQAF